MRPDVWIPEETPATERARLGDLATLHLFPAAGPFGQQDEPADLLVVVDDMTRALEVAAQLPRLGAIQTMTAGVDRIIDRVPPGVSLCDAAGVHDVAVAEWVVMVILAARRNLPAYLESQRAGQWRSDRLTGEDLVDASVLIVGSGAIGRVVEARLAPFDVRIQRISRRPRPDSRAPSELLSLLPTADVVIVLLPLTLETRGIFDAGMIAAMRPGALLVNASRGPIVDTGALTAAVLAGRIRVALDVTDPEPLPDGHPLWSAPGSIITPHVASDVRREDERAWQLIFEQVGRLARGEPLANQVVAGY